MTDKVEELIGAQIARLRKDRQLTQERLAELIGVATETISRLERGVSIPSLKTLTRISQALHTHLKDILDFDYPLKVKDITGEEEIAQVVTLLKTKRIEDIKLGYQLLRNIFELLEKHYQRKGK